MRITLRQLVAFEAVARAGSIVKAATEIGLSQSAASMSLEDFEAHLGSELFSRQGKKLLLNERGRQVREMATSILLQVQELESMITPDDLRGRLRIGATPPIGDYVLPAICADFMNLHPGVVVELTVSASMEIMNRVQKMSMDVGFVGSPVNSNYIDVTPWMRDSLVICCAPDSPWADNSRVVSITELKDERWILEKALSSERTSFTMEILKYVSSIRVGFEADSIEAIKRTVKAGDGLACISQVAVKDELERGDLARIRVPEMDFTRIYSIITRKEVYRSQAQAAFIAFAASHVEAGAEVQFSPQTPSWTVELTN